MSAEHDHGRTGSINTVLVRPLLAALLIIVACYVGYALAAGYVGSLPSPANLAAGVGVLAAAAVASVRLLRGHRAA